MTISADTLRKLAALALAPEQMAGVLTLIADMQEVEDDRKEKQRIRKARSRNNSVTVTGQEQDKDASVSPKETPPAPPKEITPSTELRSENTQTRKRASRIPEDFVPDVQAAYDVGLSDEETLSEVASFIDYWRAKPTDATKLDWPATWRNWCRKAAKDRPRSNGRGPPRNQSKNGWAELAYELEAERHEPASSNGFPPSHDASHRRGNGQAPTQDRVLDAERSAPPGSPRSGIVGR